MSSRRLTYRQLQTSHAGQRPRGRKRAPSCFPFSLRSQTLCLPPLLIISLPPRPFPLVPSPSSLPPRPFPLVPSPRPFPLVPSPLVPSNPSVLVSFLPPLRPIKLPADLFPPFLSRYPLRWTKIIHPYLRLESWEHESQMLLPSPSPSRRTLDFFGSPRYWIPLRFRPADAIFS